jgi:fumarate reductase subunit D
MTDTRHANECSLVTSLQTSESVTILLIYLVSVLSMYLPMHDYHQGQYKLQLHTATSSSLVFSLKLHN